MESSKWGAPRVQDAERGLESQVSWLQRWKSCRVGRRPTSAFTNPRGFSCSRDWSTLHTCCQQGHVIGLYTTMGCPLAHPLQCWPSRLQCTGSSTDLQKAMCVLNPLGHLYGRHHALLRPSSVAAEVCALHALAAIPRKALCSHRPRGARHISDAEISLRSVSQRAIVHPFLGHWHLMLLQKTQQEKLIASYADGSLYSII